MTDIQIPTTRDLRMTMHTAEWGLVISPHSRPGHSLVWLSEHEMPDALQRAAAQLCSEKGLFPGLTLRWVQEPEMALILEPQPGQTLGNDQELNALIERVLWELKRLAGR